MLGISKLKANYYPFEAKRKLCDSYDLFMADDRIIPSLPKLIGKSFFKKKKCVSRVVMFSVCVLCCVMLQSAPHAEVRSDAGLRS